MKIIKDYFSDIDAGVLFMFFSALISALNGAVAKILSDDISAMEMVFFRNLFGIMLILYTLKHTPPLLKGGKFHLLILRGLLGFSAMILFFYTITAIPLGVAITLNKTSPLFVSILAFFLLKERLSPVGIFALLIGFTGVLFITQPSGFTLSYEHFLGILGGFFAAAAYTTIKKIKHIYDARVIVLSFVSIGTVAPLVLFMIAPYVAGSLPNYLDFLFPIFHLPTEFSVWALIILMSLIATLSQWLLTKAYSASKVGIVAVVSYTNIPFALGFGVMLGDAMMNIYALIGAFLIIGGGLLVKRG